MARQKARAGISSATFPLLSSFSGHTVVIPQGDMTNTGKVSGASDRVGSPQIMFCENVMPMENGVTSVAYTQAIPVYDPDSRKFDQAFWLRDAAENRTLFVPAHGTNYLFLNGAWTSQVKSVPPNSFVSVANIKSRTFICYSNNALFYEWLTPNITIANFAGISPSAIRGLVAANAYLVAYSDRAIFWSSILDPTDFVPSLATTSGGSQVLSIKGRIVYCTPLADGFLIYTTSNIIAASYSGNVRFPWIFKELAGSPGISEIDVPEKMTKDSSAITQFANSVSGMIALNRTESQVIFPEVNEFLNCRRYELYDYIGARIESFDLIAPLKTKVALIANRYLVISFGKEKLQAALIFDQILKRWGKLRIDHADCFEFIGHPETTSVDPISPLRYMDLVGDYASQTQTYEELGGITEPGVIGDQQEPYKSIGFLKENGQVVIVDFDLPNTLDDSILYLGKFQLIRNRWISLYEIWAEVVGNPTVTFLDILATYNGTDFFEAITPYRAFGGDIAGKWLADLTAHSFALRFRGNFDLSSVELVYDEAGYT